MDCYEVAVVAPLLYSLTYGQPVEHAARLKPGHRVLVPLGNRLVTGYVLGPAPPPNSDPGAKQITLKPIADLLDNDPFFPADMVPLFRWIADYYHYPLGEVVRTALPGGITRASSRIIRLTSKGKDLSATLAADEKYGNAPWMEQLLSGGELPSAVVGRLWRTPAKQRRLKKWEQRGLLDIEQVLLKETNRSKTETVVSLVPEIKGKFQISDVSSPEETFHALLAMLPVETGKAEQTLLRHFSTLLFFGEGQPVSRRDLGRLYANTTKVVKCLVGKKVLCMHERRIYRDPFGERPLQVNRPEHLTDEQEKVLEVLLPAIDLDEFQTFLLFGITGCGKTEVYLRATEKALAEGKNVLVLVPEIALASQIEGHFYARFGERLAVLHSGLSAGQRLDAWQRILQGTVQVVIGARSSIFAPFANLGLIIVDEEHESSYKQDDSLRYNGRDIAVLRGKLTGCPVLLGSATPSLVSFYNTVTGKYTRLSMQRRVADQQLPAVEIIDMCAVKKSGSDLFFSDRLFHALGENLERKEQSLLFVNRRGYASFLLCRDCGHVVRCRHCHVSMTLHRGVNRLVCHYCGYTLPTEIICPGCRGGKVVPLGLGSERVETEVARLFPKARVGRLDSDTAGSRKSYLALLKAVRNREIDILIGTQMIAKGLHFPHITLVGVVWADSGLNMPDYKAAERTFSLLSQVTGRAGRGERPGRVIIQTNQPGHYAVSHAQDHNYTGFYEQEIAYRKELGYPPFSRLVNIGFSGSREEQVRQAANSVSQFLTTQVGAGKIEVLGPAPAPLFFLRDRYRYQLLLKGFDNWQLHQLCDQLLEQQTNLCPQAVRMTLDIDPENMM